MKLTKTKFIILFAVIVISILCFVSKTYGTAYVSGDYKYEVTNNKAKITGYEGSSSTVSIPSKIGNYDVIEIGYNAFRNCSEIEKLNIPSSIEKIDGYAFNGCNFTTVKFADNCKITKFAGFGNMSKLTSINIPNNVIKIDDYALQNDTKLSSITIPANVQEIGYHSFYNCTGLTTLTIPTNVSKIDVSAFTSCNFTTVKFADNCKITKFAGFGNMSKLTSINIPNNVREISDYALQYDSSLTSIKIPANVRKIGYHAFYESGVKSLSIPRRVEEIDSGAFNSCKFETVTFADDCMITKMPSFNGMSTLKSVNVPRSVKSIDDYVFQYTTSLKTLAIPSSVTSIGYHSFYGCSNLSIQIPKSVTNIDNAAFTNASVLVKCESGSTAQTFCSNKGISYSIVTIPAKKTPIQISKTAITGYDAKSYTGKEITANLVVKYNGNILKNGTDYVVEYDNNINVGNATITIIGFGDYIGKTEKNFKIVPATVTGVKASGTTNTEVTLAWNKNNGNISGYKVYTYDASSKLYNQIATTSGTSYKITGLKAGTTYRYALKAYYSNGGTTYTSTDYSAIFVTTTTPEKVSNTNFASATNDVTIEWKKVSGATGYEVYMSTSSNGNYSKITTISNNNTLKYKQTKLAAGKTYYFKVRAYRTVGNTYFGPFSNAYETTTKTNTPTISKLKAGKKKITVKLKKVSGANGYQVQYSTNKKFKKNKKSKNISKKTTKKTISKLSAKKKYYVRIRAYRKVNGKKIYSGWSKVKSVTTKR